MIASLYSLKYLYTVVGVLYFGLLQYVNDRLLAFSF